MHRLSTTQDETLDVVPISETIQMIENTLQTFTLILGTALEQASPDPGNCSISLRQSTTIEEGPHTELVCTFGCWSIRQLRLRQTPHILFAKFKELQAPFRSTTQIKGLQHLERMAVFGCNGLYLEVVADQEVLRASIWDLVADVHILVFEEMCLGGEFRA